MTARARDERPVEVESPTREWARAQIAVPPWPEVSDRITLLAVSPPAVPWADADGPRSCLIVIDASAARSLPPQLRSPLLRQGALRVDPAPGSGDGAVTTMTVEALERTIEGTARRSLETRWSVRHSRVAHDPLRRHETLGAAAARLPGDAPDRITRSLFLQVLLALDAIRGEDSGGLVAAGEAAGALARLACVLEEGSHPTAEWLLPAARETRLGRRLATWLDRLVPALAGDERAAAWVAEAGPSVLDEVSSVLRPSYGATDWFQHPWEHALGTPR